MSITSASSSCATRSATSGGSEAGAGAAAPRAGGGVRPGLSGAGAGGGTPLAGGARWRIRRGPLEYLGGGRAVAQPRAPPAVAAALYDEDPQGKRRRERLAEQLRVAPSLRYEGKGRPTKRERREIEKLKGE